MSPIEPINIPLDEITDEIRYDAWLLATGCEKEKIANSLEGRMSGKYNKLDSSDPLYRDETDMLKFVSTLTIAYAYAFYEKINEFPICDDLPDYWRRLFGFLKEAEDCCRESKS